MEIKLKSVTGEKRGKKTCWELGRRGHGGQRGGRGGPREERVNPGIGRY